MRHYGWRLVERFKQIGKTKKIVGKFDPPIVIQPGESVTVEVTFAKTEEGERESKGIPTSTLCDENCNECPLMLHPNSRMLTHVLNLLYDKFGNEVYKIVQEACPNFTVCYDCRIDDFRHYKDCKLIKL